jgi:hypothetical protein
MALPRRGRWLDLHIQQWRLPESPYNIDHGIV